MRGGSLPAYVCRVDLFRCHDPRLTAQIALCKTRMRYDLRESRLNRRGYQQSFFRGLARPYKTDNGQTPLWVTRLKGRLGSEQLSGSQSMDGMTARHCDSRFSARCASWDHEQADAMFGASRTSGLLLQGHIQMMRSQQTYEGMHTCLDWSGSWAYEGSTDISALQTPV